jgi:hypothetical protein
MRLIVHETNRNKSANTKNSVTFSVPEKMRPHLVALMGNGGFQVLYSRALALASVEIPWLRATHVKTDGSLEGFEGILPQLAPDEIFEGRVVLLAQLLGLLVAFIGEDLTVRLVCEVWPKAPLNDLNLACRVKQGKSEGENKKTK